MDETALVRQAREGDIDAFERLILLYQTDVYNLAYRMLGEPMGAEDAAQEVFVRVWRNLDRYDPSRSFRTWVLSIAAHYCIDRLRHRRPVLPLEESLLGTGDGVEGRMAEREYVQYLLAGLPPLDRAAITLRYWYDCSYAEIADILNISVAALKSRLHRARRALAQRMEGEGG